MIADMSIANMKVPGWGIVGRPEEVQPGAVAERSVALHRLGRHSERAREEEVRIGADAPLVLTFQSAVRTHDRNVGSILYVALRAGDGVVRPFAADVRFGLRSVQNHAPGVLFAQLLASGRSF